MPIRPENRDRYPPDWPEISLRVRERAGQCCEFCGVANAALGRWIEGEWWTATPKGTGLRDDPRRGESFPHFHVAHVEVRWAVVTRIILTVAHLDHRPENCADENLKALCQRCHNRYDQAHRLAGRRERARQAQAAADLFAAA